MSVQENINKITQVINSTEITQDEHIEFTNALIEVEQFVQQNVEVVIPVEETEEAVEQEPKPEVGQTQPNNLNSVRGMVPDDQVPEPITKVRKI